MTYKAVGRSIINYAAPVWSTNIRDTNYRNIQYTQNEAPRIATGCHKMSSVDDLHVEAKMLNVRERRTPHDVKHLFACPAHPTTLILSVLWSKPVASIQEFSYLEEGNLD